MDAVEPAIRALLKGTTNMAATLIAERIGSDRSVKAKAKVIRDRVRVLCPYYLPPDPASRTTYQPGQRMPRSVVPGVGHSFGPRAGRWAVVLELVLVAGYSR